MATPVAVALREKFPAAKLTWIADPRAAQLILSTCLAVNDLIELPRDANIVKQTAVLRQLKPDLLIALTPFPAAKVLSLMCGTKTLSVSDLPDSVQDVHLVERYLLTLASLTPVIPEKLFPTITPDALPAEAVLRIKQEGLLDNRPIIAFVPGVGKTMSQRAWFAEGWQYLIRHVDSWGAFQPVLLGSEDDKALCDEIAESLDKPCLNLAGQLSPTDTAVMIKQCRLVVSGDCWLLHLAVAVGTPVVGLYGATSANLRGPYGSQNLVIDQHKRCECSPALTCHNAGVIGPGQCMHKIMLEEVIATVKAALGRDQCP